MDYKKLASTILEKVGGEKNVISVGHCATRLRFNLKDDKKADTDFLKNLKGVVGVVNKGGQYQVVIGSDVRDVYKAILDLGSFNTGESDGEKEKIREL
ncbi:PTS system beta-glucoside-specific EIIBCA component [Clostridium puniceum]|uniref:PTS system beta-glucoside-specific EIIBCA component n=1 Tax=Clostridium puniceum TaxID=29367 RepID=A0A1S8TFW4_9CLOT|nr:PTS system beta-glucoside-specific EIIBCA component [Clostridium puniceum]